MALFGRRRPVLPATEADRIAAFWRWWSEQGAHRAEAGINGAGDPGAFAAELTQRVESIGDELAWELTPGDLTAHVLVICAEGQAGTRALARRVALAAPDADETWGYLDARPPDPDPDSTVLRADGADDIAFRDVVIGARMSGAHLDLVVHHPAFSDLPEDARETVSYLALSAALGEIDAQLWIGEVTAATTPPVDGFGLTGLRAAVAGLKADHTDENGQPVWTLLRGETAQGPVLAAAQVPLNPVTAPHLDTHVAVALPYAHRTEEGWPDEESLSSLRAAEDVLRRNLGAGGAVVAHQSSDGVRMLHVYLDSSAGLLDAVREVASAWPEGDASVHDMADPGWLSVQHLRT